jgi:hypothetical protein
VFSGFQRCKSLAKTIKSQRAPPCPSLARADLPSKDVADELVDCYLRAAETVYRILHVTSFKRDYDALWVSATEPDEAFLVQPKLVLAIGTITYDENFSLRASTIHLTNLFLCPIPQASDFISREHERHASAWLLALFLPENYVVNSL